MESQTNLNKLEKKRESSGKTNLPAYNFAFFLKTQTAPSFAKKKTAMVNNALNPCKSEYHVGEV